MPLIHIFRLYSALPGSVRAELPQATQIYILSAPKWRPEAPKAVEVRTDSGAVGWLTLELPQEAPSPSLPILGDASSICF